MKVSKFGGTSLADAEQIKKVCEIVLSDDDRRIVVVSAPGKRSDADTKVTDLLIATAQACLSGGSGTAEMEAVIARYADITDGLGIPEELPAVRAGLEGLLRLDKSNPAKFMDALKAAGEDNTAKVVAAYLTKNGHKARYINPGEAGMRLTDDFGNARLLDESYEQLARLGDTKERIIFPGFFGTTKNGDVVTFPRGGSDITGAILASAVTADVYENFTDVDYVYSVNPRIVSNPTPIYEITYVEMRELSYAGFAVYQEEALLPVFKRGIPVNIRNVNNPACPGTRIVPKRERPTGEHVVGVANDGDFCCIYVSKYLMNREIGFGRRVLQIVEEAGISYDHTPTGVDNMSVVFKQSQLNDASKATITSRLINELGADDVTFDHDLAMITVAGEGMSHSVGIAARAAGALSNALINIEMISQGCSEVSMFFAVRGPDEKNAVRALYDEFFS
ncbi:MAG: aspartate kinase [Oscillospiraceae bacterium]|nr:aspartate kinase [Oscillospiraceae bacterium]